MLSPISSFSIILTIFLISYYLNKKYYQIKIKKQTNIHNNKIDFLNAKEFPEMTFSSTSSKRTGERTGIVNGLLTLTGKTLPMNLDVTWNKSGIYPFGHKKYTIGISARGSFRRSSYDMNYAVANGWVGDEIQLIIELEAVQQ